MATATALGLTLTLTPPLLTTLRLTPLLTTTASLTHAYMERLTTTSFLSPPPTTTTISQLSATTTPSPAQRTAYASLIASTADVAVPAWFTNFFNTGVWSVVGLNTLTGLSAAANILLFGHALDARVRKWYVVGWAAAAAHMLFIPLVQGSVEGIIGMAVRQEVGEAPKEETEGGKLTKAQKYLRDWANVHTIRMVTVDVAAWVAFGVGVVGALTK
ncbi:hypothetical protein BU24DRAFT_97633 [Aaosphaeria arxii CBS 175.79]|uniref:DUF1772-domain-containing protein n=1 Tax=Aaosphaeria arxii CBS 175.79 TaxID=1450172 RepID=A0A6A5X6I9_9PLEO|nr:uncharacterized protein BU24DRAFT_97633 [Aaosphaeria arxii CBS 175.79]KAF2008501.1 hypothetical protein BU24DRAFT_97633 [Aaosphaeria arxii CBS 175.79]